MKQYYFLLSTAAMIRFHNGHQLTYEEVHLLHVERIGATAYNL